MGEARPPRPVTPWRAPGGDRRCKARSSRTGERCRQWAIKGGKVCPAHGGRAPQVAAAARRRVVEDQAAVELARLDVDPVTNPLEELSMLAGQAVAWKDMMAAKVNQLTSLRYEGEGLGEQLRAEVGLWERALDRCEKFCTAMARLDIDDRLAKISEAQGVVMVGFIQVALQRCGIDYADPAITGIIMAAFDEIVLGEEVTPVAAIEMPRPPELTYVCEHGQHAACRSYMPTPGMPVPPPWPARCLCDCHDPARVS